jgi:hypothetical protein|uniref:Uncharacterized protein n=1 Tax=Podoviridae sp. cttot15 TaxID=2827751 RepID=A0A8S5TM34_9CAUD|nr:MAG TPA: hypothetical protein [Podoviridae sp. cttot15]DAQ22879.1 MAG TPA: hypothetical protein [Caudoviricetes sp.]
MINIPIQTIDVAVILGVTTLIAIIGRAVMRVTRFLDHLNAMLVVWEGTDSKPGVLARLDDIEDKIADIQYHVKPNHGNSSIDAQNRQLAEIIGYLRSKTNG